MGWRPPVSRPPPPVPKKTVKCPKCKELSQVATWAEDSKCEWCSELFNRDVKLVDTEKPVATYQFDFEPLRVVAAALLVFLALRDRD